MVKNWVKLIPFGLSDRKEARWMSDVDWPRLESVWERSVDEIRPSLLASMRLKASWNW